ncbi:MAG: hypothetical protein JWM47_2245 [Acidimicrobiales bacterium]|nr:hypothetical protein [Acidimicrobiales bacterium]
MRRIVTLVFSVALLFVCSGCLPSGPGYTREALASMNGRPVQRSSCVIHYKVNHGKYADGAVSLLGLDLVQMLKGRIAAIGTLTGVRWVFDGYTKDTYESEAGEAYRNNSGVLIELRGPRTWSQPMPEKGPVYKGGAMFLDPNHFSPLRAHPDAIGNIIDHELGHQYGLGDLYDGVGGPDDRSQKMGNPQRPWGKGDRLGLQSMTEDSRRACGR